MSEGIDIKTRKKLLKKKNKFNFRRHDSHKKKRISSSWRKPTGIHNKMKGNIASKGRKVKVGYGTPRNLRGLHPSGIRPTLVRNLNDLESPDVEGIIISGKVGLKKRFEIETLADDKGIKILNRLRYPDE